jgi:hypothetical protein
MVKVAGTLQRSSEVMKLVNESMKLPEMQRTMMEMSKGEGGGGVASPWRRGCVVAQRQRGTAHGAAAPLD